jgi:hypothetical protein
MSWIVAGPWVGEFGWELMSWQGWLRRQAQYSNVVVISRPGHYPLYRDFVPVMQFVEYDPKCYGNMYRQGPVWPDHDPLKLVEMHDAMVADVAQHYGGDVVRPSRFVPINQQLFVKYGSKNPTLAADVVIHARNRSDTPKMTARNWPYEKWVTLVEQLRYAGLSVAAIGNRVHDIQVDFDYRGVHLDKLFDIIASSRLVIGPSSGPMHLASLCGTPHLVWCENSRRSYVKDNFTRYTTAWNPFQTRVEVLTRNGFDPPVDVVLDKTLQMLRA